MIYDLQLELEGGQLAKTRRVALLQESKPGLFFFFF